MKRGYTDQDLADFIDTYLARKYSRAIEQFFMGTIASVTAVTGGYQVTLTRTGESSPDGNVYQVALPDYLPTVGDKVECMWRDAASAYVLWPVGVVSPKFSTTPTSQRLNISSFDYATASTTFVEPDGSFRPAVTVPASGRVRIVGAVVCTTDTNNSDIYFGCAPLGTGAIESGGHAFSDSGKEASVSFGLSIGGLAPGPTSFVFSYRQAGSTGVHILASSRAAARSGTWMMVTTEP